MVSCPDCGTNNDASRRKCRNCNAALSKICRTPEDAFAAGWDDGANDPPLTDRQRTHLAALLAPHIRPAAKAA